MSIPGLLGNWYLQQYLIAKTTLPFNIYKDKDININESEKELSGLVDGSNITLSKSPTSIIENVIQLMNEINFKIYKIVT